MQNFTPDLTIIGGAAAGTIMLAELSRQFETGSQNFPKNIVVVDPNVNPEGGAPHTEVNTGFRVNMRTELHDIPGKLTFAEYLHRSGAVHEPPLRADLGGYARYVKHHAVDSLAAGGRDVRFVRASVTSLEIARCGYQLALDRGDTLLSRAVVIAVGNSSPTIPSNVRSVDGSISRIRRYSGDSTFAAQIGRGDDVLVLGLGPGAFDVARYLVESGSTGRIDLVSRSGRLSAVSTVGKPAASIIAKVAKIKDSLVQGKPLTLTELANELLHVFRIYDPKFDFWALSKAPSNPGTWLAEQIVLAENNGPTWAPVLEAVGRLAPEWWRMLDADNKVEFHRVWKGRYYPLRHTAPIATAKWLAGRIAEGRLRVGRLPSDVTVGKDNVWAEIEFPLVGIRRIQYGWIVLATGTEYRVTRSENPLIHQLLGTGLAKPCFAGDEEIGGLATTNLQLEGLPDVFAMGAMVRGEDLAVHSFPALVRHAKSIVKTLLERHG